jgi:hypothetical protein
LVIKPGDRVRTGPASRAAVRLSDRSVLRLAERTVLEIQPPRSAEKQRFGLLRGLLFFFDREKPADIEFETPLAAGAIRGTEFVLSAAEADGTTRLALLDGSVELTAADTSLALSAGEQGLVEPGRAPVRSPLLEAPSILQWALHYPAVGSPEDFELGADERGKFADSLAAYRAGDLLAAQQAVDSVPGEDDSQATYRAALDLSVGQVEAAELRLARVPQTSAVGRALRELMAVVRGRPLPERDLSEPRTAKRVARPILHASGELRKSRRRSMRRDAPFCWGLIPDSRASVWPNFSWLRIFVRRPGWNLITPWSSPRATPRHMPYADLIASTATIPAAHWRRSRNPSDSMPRWVRHGLVADWRSFVLATATARFVRCKRRLRSNPAARRIAVPSAKALPEWASPPWLPGN